MIFLWLLLSFKYGLGFSLHSTFVSPIQSSHYQILERKHKLKKNKNLSILHISGESTDMSGEKNVPFVVEKLNELTKESFFCLRTKDPRPSSTCTVECKRTDGKPLGWHSDAIDDSLNRRAFVFAREPGKPGTRYGKVMMNNYLFCNLLTICANFIVKENALVCDIINANIFLCMYYK